MKEYTYVTLRQKPELKEEAATWFHDKWEVTQEAYLECMEAYLNNETEYGWYLCLNSGHIVGGLGVIENDFHDRKDLTPNVCAVYTDKEYRCQGIAHEDYLLAAAYLHANFEHIHPFADGNGRVGRTVMNYYLLIHDEPPLIVYDDDKKLYYKALEAYDLTEDLAPLKTFLEMETVRTWTKPPKGAKKKNLQDYKTPDE